MLIFQLAPWWSIIQHRLYDSSTTKRSLPMPVACLQPFGQGRLVSLTPPSIEFQPCWIRGDFISSTLTQLRFLPAVQVSKFTPVQEESHERGTSAAKSSVINPKTEEIRQTGLFIGLIYPFLPSREWHIGSHRYHTKRPHRVVNI